MKTIREITFRHHNMNCPNCTNENHLCNNLPKPYSDDLTQWIFHGYPAKSNAPLLVAAAGLLGYH